MFCVRPGPLPLHAILSARGIRLCAASLGAARINEWAAADDGDAADDPESRASALRKEAMARAFRVFATRFGSEDEGEWAGSDKAAMMTDRFKRARVLRWKAVTDARRRAIHSFAPGECGTRFRQVRLACRRRVGATSGHGTSCRSKPSLQCVVGAR